MISIIICSVNPQLLSNIKENIEATIGSDYEIISFDNREKSWGICKVYNHCAEQAKYPYLLFIHEDVVFHSTDWGKELVELLKKDSIGLVGAAGAVFKSSAPTSWVSVPKKYYRTCLHNKISGLVQKKTISYVAVIDGLLLGLKKEIWLNTRFNESIEGFHLYDIDISYRIFKKNLKIAVPHSIAVEHLSNGSFTREWLEESISWHKGRELPITSFNLGSSTTRKLEAFGFIVFLNHLIRFQVYKNSWIGLFIKICLLNQRLHVSLFFRIIKNLPRHCKKKISN